MLLMSRSRATRIRTAYLRVTPPGVRYAAAASAATTRALVRRPRGVCPTQEVGLATKVQHTPVRATDRSARRPCAATGSLALVPVVLFVAARRRARPQAARALHHDGEPLGRPRLREQPGGHPDRSSRRHSRWPRCTAGRSTPSAVVAATPGAGSRPSRVPRLRQPLRHAHPQSPLIKVSAESPSQSGAIALANAGAAALAAYINRQVRDNERLRDDLRALPARPRWPIARRLETSDRLARRYANAPTRGEQGRARSRRGGDRHRAAAP